MVAILSRGDELMQEHTPGDLFYQTDGRIETES